MRFFKPDAPPFRLTTLDQRQRLFAAAGADAMIVFRFDAGLAATSAEDFVAERLVGLIGAAGVVTGEDFTFGKGRGGNVEVLGEAGARLGFSVDSVGPVSDGGEPVSSSRIRDALVRPAIARPPPRLLTRPFAIEGVVEHGDKRGRTIGYPTANIALGPYLRPRFGIYAVRGRLADGRMLDGAANLGIRPTFEPPRSCSSPISSISTATSTAGAIEVELIAFLRPEAKFDSHRRAQGADGGGLRRGEAEAGGMRVWKWLGAGGRRLRGRRLADQRLVDRASAEGAADPRRPSRPRPAIRP